MKEEAQKVITIQNLSQAENMPFKVFNKTIYLTLRRLMSYIYGAPILDVSRSRTTMQHIR